MRKQKHSSDIRFGVNERRAANLIRKASELRPRLAIVLGSGFQKVISRMQIEASISYRKIPGFLLPTVKGHAGALHLGYLGETPLVALSGRSHFYEGRSVRNITFPVRALACFGITDLLLTNAAGGINPKFRPADLMVITDHINFMGVNPLRPDEAEKEQPHFLDLSGVYDDRLRKLLKAAAGRAGIKLREGTYIAVSGPSYETPAEIRAFKQMGADAVGMSTVPEAIVARSCGVRVAGLSCISNLAAGLTSRAITHQEVLETGKRVEAVAAALIEEFAARYGAGTLV